MKMTEQTKRRMGLDGLQEAIREACLTAFGFVAAVFYLLIVVGLPLLVIAALLKFVFG